MGRIITAVVICFGNCLLSVKSLSLKKKNTGSQPVDVRFGSVAFSCFDHPENQNRSGEFGRGNLSCLGNHKHWPRGMPFINACFTALGISCTGTKQERARPCGYAQRMCEWSLRWQEAPQLPDHPQDGPPLLRSSCQGAPPSAGPPDCCHPLLPTHLSSDPTPNLLYKWTKTVIHVLTRHEYSHRQP